MAWSGGYRSFEHQTCSRGSGSRDQNDTVSPVVVTPVAPSPHVQVATCISATGVSWTRPRVDSDEGDEGGVWSKGPSLTQK